MASGLSQFAYSAAETKRVKRMQFGVLSPEEIVRLRPRAARARARAAAPV